MVFKISDPQRKVEARIILESSSQRSCITKEIVSALSLAPRCFETTIIRTFGSQSEARQVCDVVSLGVVLKDGRSIQLSFLTVLFICEPLSSQPTAYASEHYPHLAGLELADYATATEQDALSIDILVCSDNYWRLVTGNIISANIGPTVVKIKLGWVLTGAVEGVSSQICNNLVVTHALTIATHEHQDTDQELDKKLKGFRVIW